ncbi:MAG: hypothetical protein GC190_04740 [Alphaproteobacteria bacterium]|nr:hypothetical protein [Alphaproteobacteria bacterium]
MSVERDNIGPEVERLSRWRRRILFVIGVGYIIWWAGVLASITGVADAFAIAGVVNIIRIVSFVAWAVPLALLFTVGRRIGLRLRPRVRAALEDELTRANRSVAFQTGYWALLVTVCVLFAISQFEEASLKAALPILIAVGVSVPLLRFAMLERNGDRDG